MSLKNLNDTIKKYEEERERIDCPESWRMYGPYVTTDRLHIIDEFIKDLKEVNKMEEVKVNYYNCIAHIEVGGIEWLVLDDGETILVAKRWSLLRLDARRYSLLYDSEGKTKVMVHTNKDVDVMFITKRKEVIK